MPPKQQPAPPLTKQPSTTKKPPAPAPPKPTPKPASKPQPPPTPQPSTDPPQPSKPRRKPRKLTRPSADTITSPSEALTTEISALKSRMHSLESQVSSLYTQSLSTPSSPAPAPSKPPRRRGRGRGVPLPGAEEKVRKLEEEIEDVGREIGVRQREQQTAQGLGLGIEEGEEVEEVQRAEEPGRAVTLTGSYRIPLPATVSVEDVRTIQRGVRSANRIARGVLEARDGSESWSEWIGGYSMSVARFVNSIEADAAVEQQSQESKTRPGAGTRRRTAPIAAQEGSGSTSPASSTPKRPPARPRGSSSRLSQQEVETLMA